MDIFNGIYNMYIYSDSIYMYSTYAVNTYNCCNVVKGVYDMTKFISSFIYPNTITDNIVIIHETDKNNDWIIIN
jgi:hypothetical protein